VQAIDGAPNLLGIDATHASATCLCADSLMPPRTRPLLCNFFTSKSLHSSGGEQQAEDASQLNSEFSVDAHMSAASSGAN
jgi:hypothetical protein